MQRQIRSHIAGLLSAAFLFHTTSIFLTPRLTKLSESSPCQPGRSESFTYNFGERLGSPLDKNSTSDRYYKSMFWDLQSEQEDMAYFSKFLPEVSMSEEGGCSQMEKVCCCVAV